MHTLGLSNVRYTLPIECARCAGEPVPAWIYRALESSRLFHIQFQLDLLLCGVLLHQGLPMPVSYLGTMHINFEMSCLSVQLHTGADRHG